MWSWKSERGFYLNADVLSLQRGTAWTAAKWLEAHSLNFSSLIVFLIDAKIQEKFKYLATQNENSLQHNF
jgi:hypothetical protein